METKARQKNHARRGLVTALITLVSTSLRPLPSKRAENSGERTNEKAIDAAIKAGGIDKKDKKAEVEKARAKAFDERQRKILADGASNAEFHYLGSAKILGQIGKAFAEALAEMRFVYSLLPMTGTIIAMLLMKGYDISEQKAHDIRLELESRRGKRTAV